MNRTRLGAVPIPRRDVRRSAPQRRTPTQPRAWRNATVAVRGRRLTGPSMKAGIVALGNEVPYRARASPIVARRRPSPHRKRERSGGDWSRVANNRRDCAGQSTPGRAAPSLGPCASECSTSGPTPCICWWWTRTTVLPRCRRTRTRSSCASPSTSSTASGSATAGVDALVELHRLGAGGGGGPRRHRDARVRDLGDPRGQQRRRGARRGARAARASTSWCSPAPTRRA